MRPTRREVLGGAAAALVAPRAYAAGFRPLWNGRDLEGWTTWLGRPHRSADVDVPRGPDGEYVGPIGEGRDPRGVFTVVLDRGERLLRISGELFGAITTRDEFANYHLVVEWRWGQQRWPPRERDKRDGGVLIHATGPHGASGPNRNWMRSVECQIQEGDCGDLWSVGGVATKTRAVPATTDRGAPALRYDPRGPIVEVPIGRTDREPRVLRSVNAERPSGEWNTTDVLTVGANATFRVNGKRVMDVLDARVPDERGNWRPLTRGKLQLQSEGAEMYVRRVEIRPLARLPA